MPTNSTHPDDRSPRSTPIVRAFAWLALVLTAYVLVAIVDDPLPYPAKEIACGVVIALVLAGNAWRWVNWFRAEGTRPSLARRVVWTALALLVVYVFFREVYFDPLPGALGSVLALSPFPLLLGLITWSIAGTRDEVTRASAFEGFAWGALVGLGLIYASIFALRFAPGLSDWLQAIADTPGPLSPAARGFMAGAGYSLIVVWTSLIVSQALWWARMR